MYVWIYIYVCTYMYIYIYIYMYIRRSTKQTFVSLHSDPGVLNIYLPTPTVGYTCDKHLNINLYSTHTVFHHDQSAISGLKNTIMKYTEALIPPLSCGVRSLNKPHDFLNCGTVWNARLHALTSHRYSPGRFSSP